jgi:hypothetical protein
VGATPKADAPNASLTDADWKIVETCHGSDELDELNSVQATFGPWGEPLAAVAAGLSALPDAKTAIEELRSCYTQAGLTPVQAEPWSVEGADLSVVSEEQIRLALQVVACKEQTNFTARMADLEAAQQAPIVVKYQDELIEHRRALDAALDHAREIIAGRPDLVAAGS